jgi:hypothetical protein
MIEHQHQELAALRSHTVISKLWEIGKVLEVSCITSIAAPAISHLYFLSP